MEYKITKEVYSADSVNPNGKEIIVVDAKSNLYKITSKTFKKLRKLLTIEYIQSYE